ncbi:hypothetical protein ACFL4D_00900 [Candidatus Margulisiibacteriota bacterium]
MKKSKYKIKKISRFILLASLIIGCIIFGPLTSLAATGGSYEIITGNQLLCGTGGYSTWNNQAATGNYISIDTLGALAASLNATGSGVTTNGSGLIAWLFDLNTPNQVTTITPSKNYSTNALMFMWSVPTDDYLSSDHMKFNIYRATSSNFSDAQIVGLMVSTSDAQNGYPVSLQSGTSLNFFMIKTVDGDGHQFPTSNVGMAISIFATPNTTLADEMRIDIPYNSCYTTALDFVNDFDSTASNLQRIEYWNYDSQSYHSMVRLGQGFGWFSPNNFVLTANNTFSVVVQDGPVTFNVVGVNDKTVAFTVAAHGTEDEYRMSLPYNSVYTNLSDLTTALNGGSTSVNVSRIASRGFSTQTTVKDRQFIPGLEWQGDTTITPGEEYFIKVTASGGGLTSWKPELVEVQY